MEPEKRLQRKVAIITGGASGIGEATARLFADHGATAVLCDLQDELGGRVAGEIVAAGGSAEYRHLDTRQEDEWTGLVEAVEGKYGRIDVLCNVAGIGSAVDTTSGKRARMELPGLSLDSWNQVMAVNAAGVFLGTKSIHPAMKRAGGGSIINISSSISRRSAGSSVRLATPPTTRRKGPCGFSRSRRRCKYAVDQIRVNSVHPGFVETPLAAPGLVGKPGETRMNATPLGRYGKPSDIAFGCLYLASDETAWMTGSELVIDGGMTAN